MLLFGCLFSGCFNAPGNAEGGVASLRLVVWGVSGRLVLPARSRRDIIDIVSALSIRDVVVCIDELLDFLDNILPNFHRLELVDCWDHTLEVSVASFGGNDVGVRRNKLATPEVIEYLDCEDGGRGNSTWKLDEGRAANPDTTNISQTRSTCENADWKIWTYVCRACWD